MSNNKFLVTVNPDNMLATLHFDNVNSKVFKSVKFSLSSISDQIEPLDTGLVIPWFDLRHGLVNISYILKKENIGVEFGDFAGDLLRDYLDDRKKSRETDSNFTYTQMEAKRILQQEGFKRNLTEEQTRDLLRLLSLKHGANFSVPGAGKTTTLLALHTILKSKLSVDKLFVISPINAFISWEDETLAIFGPDYFQIKRLTLSDIREPRKILEDTSGVYLVNYEKLRSDIKGLFPFFLHSKTHLVLDEAHRIKSGWDNLSFQQIIKLADLSVRRDIMTGTPMPQNYLDLDAQFYFLWRNNILPTFSRESNEGKILEKLNTLLSPKFVRTTKNELGLKNPTIRYNIVEMGPIQSELYGLFKSEAARKLSGMEQGTKSYFRSIGGSAVRLLQAATNPMLLGMDDDYFDEILDIPPGSEIWELLSEFSRYEKPAKIQHLLKRVSEILCQNSKNKIVIWSYFIRNIQLLERLLEEFNPVSIYGGVPTGDDQSELYREGRIRKFHQDETCRILIANPQACGEGISLHKASHFAIYLDRNFNAAYFLQSIDRIHRLGLDKSVDTTIEILIAKNTIDELLINRLNQKTEAMGKVLNDPYLLRLAYDPSDIPDEDALGLDTEDIEKIRYHILENHGSK